MHYKRKYIALEWGLVAILLIVSCFYLYTVFASKGTSNLKVSGRGKDFSVKKLQINTEPLKTAFNIFPNLDEDRGRHIKNLFACPVKEIKLEKVPDLIVSMIFIGQNKKYAVVNENIYTSGDMLPGGKKIKAINKDSLLIADNGKEKRIYYKDPETVYLSK